MDWSKLIIWFQAHFIDDDDGNPVTDPFITANLFNRQFAYLHQSHHAISYTGYENPELVELNASKFQHISPFKIHKKTAHLCVEPIKIDRYYKVMWVRWSK
jgi:hypothetical protein